MRNFTSIDVIERQMMFVNFPQTSLSVVKSSDLSVHYDDF